MEVVYASLHERAQRCTCIIGQCDNPGRYWDAATDTTHADYMCSAPQIYDCPTHGYERMSRIHVGLYPEIARPVCLFRHRYGLGDLDLGIEISATCIVHGTFAENLDRCLCLSTYEDGLLVGTRYDERCPLHGHLTATEYIERCTCGRLPASRPCPVHNNGDGYVTRRGPVQLGVETVRGTPVSAPAYRTLRDPSGIEIGRVRVMDAPLPADAGDNWYMEMHYRPHYRIVASDHTDAYAFMVSSVSANSVSIDFGKQPEPAAIKRSVVRRNR